MKKFLIFLLYFIQFNLFSQDSRFIVFRKSFKENGIWVYKNQPCDIGLHFNESSVKLDLDVYYFWEILNSYPMKVNGKVNSVDYDVKDISGVNCTIQVSGNDDTPKEATLTVIYPNKIFIWDFKER